MPNLQTDFHSHSGHVIDMTVPPLVMDIFNEIRDITGADQICIAGGFCRGLYMQQKMGLSPQMNDIDIFGDLPCQQEGIKRTLIEKFGPTIRINLGVFEDHDTSKNHGHFRELLKFNIPRNLRKFVANAHSIELNFGLNHPFANPYAYVDLANVGINQIAITPEGKVIASELFFHDMKNQTMTMNPHRNWIPYDWEKTLERLKKMQVERPEFQGWKIIKTQQPILPEQGLFWNEQRTLLSCAPQNPGA